MSIKPVGSIFDMSIAQIDFYSTRLYPHNYMQGYWGFSSVTEFLSPNEDLLQRGYNDCYLIESQGFTYNANIRKLIKICSVVMFGEKTGTKDGKFRFWRTDSTKEFRQLIPQFSFSLALENLKNTNLEIFDNDFHGKSAINNHFIDPDHKLLIYQDSSKQPKVLTLYYKDIDQIVKDVPIDYSEKPGLLKIGNKF